jgi:hypothetical protein
MFVMRFACVRMCSCREDEIVSLSVTFEPEPDLAPNLQMHFEGQGRNAKQARPECEAGRVLVWCES